GVRATAGGDAGVRWQALVASSAVTTRQVTAAGIPAIGRRDFAWPARSGSVRRDTGHGIGAKTMTDRRRVAGWAMVAALVGVAACSHEPERRPATPLDHSTVGVIEGEVRFAGTPPAASTVDMSSAKDCAAQ